MGLDDITVERFTERLKKHRKEKGFSQRELAKLAGVSKATIGKLENGTMPRIDNLVSLSRALGIAFNYLIGFIDDPYDIEVREVQEIWDDLSPADRANLYEYAAFLLHKGKENNTNE